MQRIVKPKTQRGQRFLEKREPKVFENTKHTLFFKGGNTSQTVTKVLKEWYVLKKPDATMFSKKNVTRPFDDQSSVEFFSGKTDSSLFMFGSHNKKRPHNLVIGRLFNGNVLDMAEFGVENFVSMDEFKESKPRLGTKPCIVFSGEMFEETEENRRVKNLLIDFFRGPNVDNVCLSGLEHVITVHGDKGMIYVRSYRILMKKSGSRIPRVELEPVGPSMDMTPRRTHLATDDAFKRALKKPTEAKPKKKKNISSDQLGNRLGRVHMKTQAFDKLQARKLKGLKKQKTPRSETSKVSSAANPRRQKTPRSDTSKVPSAANPRKRKMPGSEKIKKPSAAKPNRPRVPGSQKTTNPSAAKKPRKK